ncbi:PREDICTED: uncharacterized protein LOC105566732 [Vollenhovia emeryi]|uniref:uncharacterized protein LOC105566732 n=1 Tax=Vollenhovia emeryi TaxID=411798 RepID=UPI0005F467E2|nr:PREDICTED: uncharacterized protein LOC105566732 [Vollenhovia emeryi]XP_011876353.1 PREDICTED: uncharacterized protein LOC105566732 [Vollenhovia emeryi]
MKYLYIGFALLAFNCVTWGQDVSYPTDEETSHVSGGNSTTIEDRIPVSEPDSCPKDMLRYPGDGGKDSWVCDCRPRFLYFPLNDSCYEAYRQGPCPPKNYVVLPEDEAVPRCVENPCSVDGEVQFNDTCYPLRTRGGPCAPDGVIGVNETTFELECVEASIAPFIIIELPTRVCPPGSKRSTLGACKKVLRLSKVRQAASG